MLQDQHRDVARGGGASTIRTSGFPVDALPAWVADMVNANAEFSQTDPAMSGTISLSVLSAAVAGRIVIRPRPGYTEQLSLYTATIANPSERKSSVTKALTAPLYAVETRLNEEIEPIREEARVLARITERAAATAEKIAGNDPSDTQAVADAVSATQRHEQALADIPALPRLLADDATPEALAALMAEQGGRIAIISAEGGVFGQIAGRYSNGVPNLDVYLKAYDGDPLNTDRLGRERVRIDSPALVIGIAVQPGVLAEAIEKRILIDSGMISRFSFARTASTVGHRRVDSPAIPDDVVSKYAEHIEQLILDARTLPEGATLNLSPAAEDSYLDFAAKIETRLDPRKIDSLTMQLWAAKHVGRVMRIAALIHLAQHGVTATTVQPHSIEAAIRIGEYLWSSARATFAEAAQTDEDRDAAYVLQKAAEKFPDGQPFKDSDLLRVCRRFTSVRLLRPIRARLVEDERLEELPQETGMYRVKSVNP